MVQWYTQAALSVWDTPDFQDSVPDSVYPKRPDFVASEAEMAAYLTRIDTARIDRWVTWANDILHGVGEELDPLTGGNQALEQSIHSEEGGFAIRYKEGVPYKAKIPEFREIMILCAYAFPKGNWYKQQHLNRILSERVLQVPDDFVWAHNDYLFEHYRNKEDIRTNHLPTLAPRYALRLAFLHAFANMKHAMENDQNKIVLAFPFAIHSAFYSDVPLDSLTLDRKTHKGFRDTMAIAKALIARVDLESLHEDQLKLFKVLCAFISARA